MCTTFVAKLVLGLVNTLVFTVGLAMFVIGLLVQTSPDLSQKALSSVLDRLKFVTDQAGVNVDTSNFSAADIAFSFSVAIMAVGLLLAAVSVLGLIGVKYSLKPVLIVYFIVTLVLFLAQVIVVLIVVIDRDAFNDAVKPHLRDTITDSFTGLEGTDPATQIWNGLNSQLECCGVDGYKDFEQASKWNKTINSVAYPNLQAPVSCCRNITGPPFSCATTPINTADIWDTGCYDKIWDYIISNSGIVTGIAAGVLVTQLIILILTCVIIKDTGKVGV